MSIMVPELERPRVTEIQVRMDCNGCVQKVKKALNGITGIYDVYINYPEQKITILGWADLEKIVKAIRKTRKTATICAHFEPEAAAQPGEQAAEDAPPPAPDGANPPPPEGGYADTPNDQPQPPPDNPQQAAIAAVPVTDAPSYDAGQTPYQLRPEEVQSVRVTYHQPPDHFRNAYSHQGAQEWNNFQTDHGGYQGQQWLHQQQTCVAQPPPPIHEPHNYIAHRPPPQMSLTQPSTPRTVRATHNYNTRRPVSQSYAIQPPQMSSSPTTQESHSYQLSRPQTQTYIIQQPPQMPEAQPPPPQIQEPEHYYYYGNYRSSPKTFTSQPQQQYQAFQPPQQVQSTRSYNTYSPLPHVSEYDYIQPLAPAPAPAPYSSHNRMGRHYEDYSSSSSSSSSSNNGDISSMFSDENPNACTIM